MPCAWLFRSGTRALLAWFRSRFSGTPIGPMSFGRLSAAAARLFPRRAPLVRRCSSGGGPLALDGLLIPKAFVESEMPAIVDLFSAFAVPGQSERELDAGGRAAHSPCAPAPVAARPHASRPRQPLRAAANSTPTPPPLSFSVCLSVCQAAEGAGRGGRAPVARDAAPHVRRGRHGAHWLGSG